MDFPDLDPNTAAKWCQVPGDWRRPNVPETYDLIWDKTRDYGQVWPRPDAESVTTFYELEEYHTHQLDNGQSAKKSGLSQRIMTRLAWSLDKSNDPDKGWWAKTLGAQPRKVLEVGCGRGAHAAKIVALGHDVRGVEPDKKSRRIAQDYGFMVEDGTAESLPDAITSETYDALVYMHVLEHCVDPFKALGNAVQLLNPDGLLVVEVPNNACAGCSYYGPLWAWLDVPRHLNFFTETSLKALFDAVSLDIVEVSYRGYTRQFQPEWKANQSRIADVFGMSDDRRVRDASYWGYMMRTAFADPAKKYDSVRIVGKLRA